MQTSTDKAPETRIIVTIYGFNFRWKLITQFARQQKISQEEVVHMLTQKLDWLGQFLDIDYGGNKK